MVPTNLQQRAADVITLFHPSLCSNSLPQVRERRDHRLYHPPLRYPEDNPATSARYLGVQFFLEDLLGRPVHLITQKSLRPELRPYVERAAVRV
jgi:hypothetical protein